MFDFYKDYPADKVELPVSLLLIDFAVMFFCWMVWLNVSYSEIKIVTAHMASSAPCSHLPESINLVFLFSLGLGTARLLRYFNTSAVPENGQKRRDSLAPGSLCALQPSLFLYLLLFWVLGLFLLFLWKEVNVNISRSEDDRPVPTLLSAWCWGNCTSNTAPRRALSSAVPSYRTAQTASLIWCYAVNWIVAGNSPGYWFLRTVYRSLLEFALADFLDCGLFPPSTYGCCF